MFGVVVLLSGTSGLFFMVGCAVGLKAGSRGFRVGAILLAILAVGVAVALNVAVDDGQPFVLEVGRIARNRAVTNGPRGWLYLRSLLFHSGIAILCGAIFLRGIVLWAKRKDRDPQAR